MQPRVALVLGGTGAVGGAALGELARRGVPTSFTYCKSAERARSLAAEHGQHAFRIDLADAAATTAGLDAVAAERGVPDILIHCAGVSAAPALADLGVEQWREAVAVNAHSALLACQWLARRAPPGAPVDVVFVGGLDRTQSLPLPVDFAATQGMLSAMVMALAHELGPRGFRVNMMALGMLDAGLSRSLVARRRKDYESFSALRRLGTPTEAARAIVWLALENSYVQGKVLPVNGGI